MVHEILDTSILQAKRNERDPIKESSRKLCDGFPCASRSASNLCARVNCGRVGCSSSGIAWSASSPSSSCTSRVSMASASSSSACSSSSNVKMEVAISCGALPCRSPSGSGPRLPLRKSVPSAMCCLAFSSTWAGSWSTMCLQLLKWIFSRLCNARTASFTQTRHVIPVLCKAVGENDASTCTDGVEHCGRKEVAAHSGQRVLEGFHHPNDPLAVPRTCCRD